LGIGDREGPRIYPKVYHTELYKISYEMVRHEKPRVSIETSELERPIFYGFPRTRRRTSGLMRSTKNATKALDSLPTVVRVMVSLATPHTSPAARRTLSSSRRDRRSGLCGSSSPGFRVGGGGGSGSL